MKFETKIVRGNIKPDPTTGAIIPPLYGFLTDQFHFKLALLLIVLCYAYILYFGWIKSKVSVRIVWNC